MENLPSAHSPAQPGTAPSSSASSSRTRLVCTARAMAVLAGLAGAERAQPAEYAVGPHRWANKLT